MHTIDPQDIEEMNAIDDDDIIPLDYRMIAKAQVKDKSFMETVNKYTKDIVDEIPVYKYKGRIVLPNSLVSKVIHWYHINLCHPGVTRTYQTIALHFTALKLQQRVAAAVKSCANCSQSKNTLPKYDKLPPATDAIYFGNDTS